MSKAVKCDRPGCEKLQAMTKQVSTGSSKLYLDGEIAVSASQEVPVDRAEGWGRMTIERTVEDSTESHELDLCPWCAADMVDALKDDTNRSRDAWLRRTEIFEQMAEEPLPS